MGVQAFLEEISNPHRSKGHARGRPPLTTRDEEQSGNMRCG